MSTVKTNNVQLGQSVTATNNFTWYQPASPDGTVRLGNGNAGSVTDLVTLTSAGNLGIGTVTPTTKLHVSGTGSTPSLFERTGSNGVYLQLKDASGSSVYLGASNGVFAIQTPGSSYSDKLVIDSAGNLGLGVTPSAWGGGFKAIQMTAGASFGSHPSVPLAYVNANSYFDGSNNRYIQNSFASRFISDGNSGGFAWQIAASGTAGNAITFTQAMTLDANGNLHVPGGGGIATNEAFGTGALRANTTGSYNTASGVYALYYNTTGAYNTASGVYALYSNTTGIYNTASGQGALYSNTTGNNNTANGLQALFSNTTGNLNTANGVNALFSNTTGSSNVGIGYGCNGSSATVSNEVNIYNGSVTARFQGAAGAWSFVSDARDKTDIEPLTLGLDFVTGLQPRKFKWDIRNCDVDKGKEASGFIAQEVLDVIEICNAEYTGLVDTNDPNQYTIATGNLIPILVNAIKELTTRLEALEAK